MKISKIPGLGSFGHYIDNIDFNHLTDEEWIEIGKLHLTGLVTILRNVTISKDQYYNAIPKFGPIKSNLKGYMIKKYGKILDALDFELGPILQIDDDDKLYLNQKKYLLDKTEGGNYLTRVYGGKDEQGHTLGLFAGGDVRWHSNESSSLTFSPGVALLGYSHMIGSSTGFVQTVDLYDSLSGSFKSELDEMVLIHKYTPGKINDNEFLDTGVASNIRRGFCPVDGAETPLVIVSPGGHKGLHYTINSVVGIKGMSDAESAQLFDKLDKLLFTDEYVYDHQYKNDNDLLLFDNSITLHRRTGGDKERLAYRIQFDYSNLLEAPWRPYTQIEFAQSYKKQIHELINLLDIKEFKLP